VREALRVGPSRPRVTASEWVALTLGLLAVSAVLDQALEMLGWRAGSRLVAIERALGDMGAGNRLIALGGIALAPAIGEEILFRGLILGALLRRTPTWAAIGASALLFGAAHQDLAQGLATAVLGLYLGAASVATGSVRVPVAAHFCNNAAALLAPVAAQRLAGRPALSLALTIGLAAAAWAAGRTLVRRLRPDPSRPP
jgi:membrane protease YdiL (CAAX protease family)